MGIAGSCARPIGASEDHPFWTGFLRDFVQGLGRVTQVISAHEAAKAATSHMLSTT